MIIIKIQIVILSILLPMLSAQPHQDYDYTESAEEPAHIERSSIPSTDNSSLPMYLSLAGNINDFGRFADGGSDSNWYIGFNNAWIVKLPPIPSRKYTRAFLGAKIGRAKTRPKSDKPWELSVIPGKIYIAISQIPAFTSEQSFFLVDTTDIPLEQDENIYVPGTGRSEWFWAEIPMKLISFSRPNYMIIWSPNKEFQEASSAPILAALQGAVENSSEVQAWNNRSIRGVPPRTETGALQVPINNIRPALAIKLIPPYKANVRVNELFVQAIGANELLASFASEGRNITLAWIEASSDGFEWKRITHYLRYPPYFFTLSRSLISSQGIYFRAKARDLLHNEGASPHTFITHDVNIK